MAQYAVFLHHAATRPTPDPDTLAAQLAEHDAYARDLEATGLMIYGAPLADPSSTVSIGAEGVWQGPWSDHDDVVVGYYVIDVPDLTAALEVAGRNPIIGQGGGVEVRPLALT